MTMTKCSYTYKHSVVRIWS